jgi:phosphate transport system ATP-binding protein
VLELLTSPSKTPGIRREGSEGRGRVPNTEVKPVADSMIQVREMNLKYGEKQALFNVNLDIPARKATAFIGPSGCGKTTLLRCFNRLNDLIDHVTLTGTIRIHGLDIYNPEVDVSELRKKYAAVSF